MHLPRETYYGELFNRLKALEGGSVFVTVEQRLRHWDSVPGSEQPYIGMAHGSEEASYAAGRTEAWYLRCILYVYITESDPAGVPRIKLSQALDAINAVFAPDNANVNACTFNGLVHYARIQGNIETDEGTLGEQAVARVPVEMLVVG